MHLIENVTSILLLLWPYRSSHVNIEYPLKCVRIVGWFVCDVLLLMACPFAVFEVCKLKKNWYCSIW